MPNSVRRIVAENVSGSDAVGGVLSEESEQAKSRLKIGAARKLRESRVRGMGIYRLLFGHRSIRMLTRIGQKVRRSSAHTWCCHFIPPPPLGFPQRPSPTGSPSARSITRVGHGWRHGLLWICLCWGDRFQLLWGRSVPFFDAWWPVTSLKSETALFKAKRVAITVSEFTRKTLKQPDPLYQPLEIGSLSLNNSQQVTDP